MGYYGDPFNKNVPLESFLEVLDTQCVRFHYQESELYLMELKYGGVAKIIYCEVLGLNGLEIYDCLCLPFLNC